ncbi:MAG: hypothetical protein ACTHM6_16295 [Tepidisphaeraceae bacterium]
MRTRVAETRRRGIAMILVILVVAFSSVLVLSMLSSAAVHAQVNATSAVRVQAQYLAESGLNLAMYYLKNPGASPVSLVYGANGNVHYPGETGISIDGMPGTIDLAITNPSNGQFAITSTGTYQGVSVSADATVAVKKSKKLTNAAYFSWSVTLNSGASITGGAITDNSLQQNYTGQVQGTITTKTSGVAADLQSTNFDYPISMFHYLPTYFYNGKSYQAKELASNFTGGILYDGSASNPCNVWYVAKNNIAISGITILNGSLVTLSGVGLKVSGSLTITPTANLPALAVGKDLTYGAASTYITCNGPTYLSGVLRGTGLGISLLTGLTVNGTFISGNGGYPVNSSYKGAVTLKWVQSQAKTVAFADEMETIQSVTAQSWDTDNSRPE